jgi:PAS domain S-box-containing protein
MGGESRMKKRGSGTSKDGTVLPANDFDTAEVLVHDEQKYHTVPVTGSGREEIPAYLLKSWQRTLDVLTAQLCADTGVVMRIVDKSVEVLLASGEQSVPFVLGNRIPFGSGSYCEESIGLNQFVSIDTDQWKSCSQSSRAGSYRRYCGIPLHWEDKTFFGTLCLLGGDNFKEERSQPIIEECAESMEKDLQLLAMRQDRDNKYEKAMEAILQYSPGGIFSYSAEEDEQFSFLSENMLSFLGYTQEQFIDKFKNRFSYMVYAKDRERVLREIDEQIQHGAFDNCEYRIERGDGSLVWVHDEGHIVADACGKRWFYVVIVDISASVEAREREREKFRSAIQSLLTANPEAIGTRKINLTQNTCDEGHGTSKVAREILETDTVDDFFSRIAGRIPNAEVRERFTVRFDRLSLLQKFNEGVTNVNLEYLRADTWVKTNLKMLANPDTGDVEGVIYSVDISGEKRREEIMQIITSREYDLIALIHLRDRTFEAYHVGASLPEAYRALLPARGSVCDFDLYSAEARRHMDDETRADYQRRLSADYMRENLAGSRTYEFTLKEYFPECRYGYMYRKFQHYRLESDPDAVLVIESDVTDAVLKQQLELSRAKDEAEHDRLILDSVLGGISVLILDEEGNLSVDYFNTYVYQMLGYDPEGIPQRADDAKGTPQESAFADALTFIHPDDKEYVRQEFLTHRYDKTFALRPYRMAGNDGVYRWVLERVRTSEPQNGRQILYAAFHDVTEEVSLQETVRMQLDVEKQLRKKADAANEAKTDFLSRMSHDIRTPLNGIIGMTYLTQKMELPETAQANLKKIETSSKFLLSLINDILDMSKFESQKIELHPEPYPFDKFCDYIDAVIRPLCDEKQQTFLMDTDPIAECTPVVDITWLNRIYFNLLSNAVKYTPEGGTITLKIREKQLEEEKIQFTVSVTDNGIGMSSEFQKHLFEPFTQENRSDTSEMRGTGLGLAIVKRAVDAMGGTLSVQSEKGRGSCFTAVIVSPCIKKMALSRPKSEAGQADGEEFACLGGKHVLLCEDHPLNQEIAKALLEDKRMLVQIAEDGQKAVEMFSKSPVDYFDFILMDVRMPVMDGVAATRKIRALSRSDAKKVPILAMTADAFAEDVQKCRDAGMDGHVAKPIEPGALYNTLADIISR